jgi:hypothetical protein
VCKCFHDGLVVTRHLLKISSPCASVELVSSIISLAVDYAWSYTAEDTKRRCVNNSASCRTQGSSLSPSIRSSTPTDSITFRHSTSGGYEYRFRHNKKTSRKQFNDGGFLGLLYTVQCALFDPAFRRIVMYLFQGFNTLLRNAGTKQTARYPSPPPQNITIGTTDPKT